MGVPTFKFKLWAFAMGASIGGLGGWIYATKVGFINPDNVPVQPVVPDPRRRRARRHGIDPGRHRRRVRRRLHPGVPAQAAGGESVLDFLNSVTGGSRAATSPSTACFLFGLALVLMMIFRPRD